MDKLKTYKATRQPTLCEELRGEGPLSQYQRALKELGINDIHANSAEAKGRVERLFGTLQDRLIKEMRLAKIKTMEEANEFLDDYLPRHNERFAKKALKQGDLHQSQKEKASVKRKGKYIPPPDHPWRRHNPALHHNCYLEKI